MYNLFLVFSARPDSSVWMPEFKLRAVYTEDKLAELHQMFMDKATENVVSNMKTTFIREPKPLMESWKNDKERNVMMQELAIELKALRKKSNEYRLAGDFDNFIITNTDIHNKKEVYKQIKEYDKQIKAYRRETKSRNVGGQTYDDMLKAEYEKLSNRIQIIKIETEFEYEDFVEISVYRSPVGILDKVVYEDELNFEQYAAYLDFKARYEQSQEKYTKLINDADSLFTANRALLDTKKNAGMDVSSDSYKKAFKVATDAFYRLKKLEAEYIAFLTNTADQLKNIESKFKTYCYTITAPINTDFSCNNAIHDSTYSIHEVRRFGTRVRLEDFVSELQSSF